MKVLFGAVFSFVVLQGAPASSVAEDRPGACLDESIERDDVATDNSHVKPDETRMRQIACAVNKALAVAVEQGFRAERSMIVVEPSSDRETARVEIGSPTFRGGGVCVEVRLGNCEVVDVVHLQ